MSSAEASTEMHKSLPNKINFEHQLFDFFRLIDTLFPRACNFLKSNFRISQFKRRTRELNLNKLTSWLQLNANHMNVVGENYPNQWIQTKYLSTEGIEIYK